MNHIVHSFFVEFVFFTALPVQYRCIFLAIHIKNTFGKGETFIRTVKNICADTFAIYNMLMIISPMLDKRMHAYLIPCTVNSIFSTLVIIQSYLHINIYLIIVNRQVKSYHFICTNKMFTTPSNNNCVQLFKLQFVTLCGSIFSGIISKVMSSILAMVSIVAKEILRDTWRWPNNTRCRTIKSPPQSHSWGNSQTPMD